MNRRSALVLVATLAMAGSAATACTSSGPPSTASAKTSIADTAASGASATPAPSQSSSSRVLTEAQLRAALITLNDLPSPGFRVDDSLGSRPDGIGSGSDGFYGRHSTFEGVGMLFGFVDDADTQPCAALLNAIGYGRNAEASTVWAQVDFGAPGTGVTEFAAAYPPGRAAAVVAGIASAGSGTCHQVTDERNTKMTETVNSLRVGPVGPAGGTTAGAQTLISLAPTGSRLYLIAAVQVGDYVVIVSGTELSRTGTAVFDPNLLSGALTRATAKLAAAVQQ